MLVSIFWNKSRISFIPWFCDEALALKTRALWKTSLWLGAAVKEYTRHSKNNSSWTWHIACAEALATRVIGVVRHAKDFKVARIPDVTWKTAQKAPKSWEHPSFLAFQSSQTSATSRGTRADKVKNIKNLIPLIGKAPPTYPLSFGSAWPLERW